MPAPRLPAARGPLSSTLFDHWNGAPRTTVPPATIDGLDPLVDDDLQLALWCCYALHYRGFAGVDDRFEWDPVTIEFRLTLERAFEAALRADHRPEDLPSDPVDALRAMTEREGPPLSRTVEERGERWHLEEFAIHRSAYQLKEADAHTWGIPRLAGPGRAAMIEIQADEYGGGRPGEAHSELFAAALADLGLCPDFGNYIDRLPGTTLATDNLVSMFGLHRRLRGALVGHLALFEMCSVVPMGRYLAAARRVGSLPSLERFYAIHVEADVHHAWLALEQMVRPFVGSEPHLGPEVIFGADAMAQVEARFARHVLDRWRVGATSLRAESLALAL